MNSQTSVKSVWNRIRKIKGKDTSNTVHHLSVNDRDVTSHRDIANALADNVSHNSSEVKEKHQVDASIAGNVFHLVLLTYHGLYAEHPATLP